MNEAGQVYRIEGSKLCHDMMPFGASFSSPVATQIVLTNAELQALDNLAQSNGYDLGKISLLPSLP